MDKKVADDHLRFVPPPGDPPNGKPVSPGSVHGLGHEIIDAIEAYMHRNRACSLGTIRLALAKVDAVIAMVVIDRLSTQGKPKDEPEA